MQIRLVCKDWNKKKYAKNHLNLPKQKCFYWANIRYTALWPKVSNPPGSVLSRRGKHLTYWHQRIPFHRLSLHCLCHPATQRESSRGFNINPVINNIGKAGKYLKSMEERWHVTREKICFPLLFLTFIWFFCIGLTLRTHSVSLICLFLL